MSDQPEAAVRRTGRAAPRGTCVDCLMTDSVAPGSRQPGTGALWEAAAGGCDVEER